MSPLPVLILDNACVCGHDHKTEREEHVERCLECNCDEMVPRCQNCGEDAAGFTGGWTGFRACSRRCDLQLQHATQRLRATA